MTTQEYNEEQAYREIEADVYRVLNSGDRAELLKKSDSALVHILQSAQDAHPSMMYSLSQCLIPWIQKWKKHVKEDVDSEGNEVDLESGVDCE